LTILGLILLQLLFPVAIVIPTPAFAGMTYGAGMTDLTFTQ